MILDSRGYPTVEVDCYLDDMSMGRASVPSGASVGEHEAVEIRDGEKEYAGYGVTKVIGHINTIVLPEVKKLDDPTQQALDSLLIALDGTKNKDKLGANALLPVSLAFAKAVAISKGVPLYKYIRDSYEWKKEMSLPMPFINVLNGGKHAPGSTDVQEWMIVPIAATSFDEALEISARVYYVLRKNMIQRGSAAVGDEGGFSLTGVRSNEEALRILNDAVQEAGLVPGKDIAYAIDVAASELYINGEYKLTCENRVLNQSQMIDWLSELKNKYAIISIEDGLSEDDWLGWKMLTEKISSNTQIVGDDLFVTNVSLLKRGHEEKSANTVLIKLNQIGTLSETVDAIVFAHTHNMKAIVSHRSGETEDTTIAHLVVASGCGQIKTGSLSRTERLAKYNELLRIEEDVKVFASH